MGGAKEQYHHTLSSATSTDTLSALPQFALNDKFVLNQDECWYTLSIELQVCIECVVLQVRRASGLKCRRIESLGWYRNEEGCGT